jgi:hypothetical protein
MPTNLAPNLLESIRQGNYSIHLYLPSGLNVIYCFGAQSGTNALSKRWQALYIPFDHFSKQYPGYANCQQTHIVVFAMISNTTLPQYFPPTQGFGAVLRTA